MVIVKVDLPDNINDRFKAKVMEIYGLKRGAITSALIDAIKLWTEQSDNNNKPSDQEDFDVPSELRDKYLAINNNEIIIVADSLDELWDTLSVDAKMRYEIHVPRVPGKRRVKLGWATSFKRK